jgi:hypothetical protein
MIILKLTMYPRRKRILYVPYLIKNTNDERDHGIGKYNNWNNIEKNFYILTRRSETVIMFGMTIIRFKG